MNKKIFLFTAIMMMFSMPLMADSNSTANSASSASTAVDVYAPGAGASSQTNSTLSSQIDASTTIEAAKIPGALPIPHELQFGPMPNIPYTNDIPVGANVQSIGSIILYQQTFTIAELEAMKNDSYDAVKVKAKTIRQQENLSDSITIFISKDDKIITNAELVGNIIANGKNKEVSTVEVLASLGLAAHKMGANVVHITGEGAERLVKASGWGIGAAYTSANVASSGDNAVATGGTGFSSGTGGFTHLPFLQASAILARK